MVNNLIAISRYMVVHYPMKSLFMVPSFVKRVLLTTFCVVLLIAFVLSFFDNGMHFSDGLSLPLGSKDCSTSSKYFTFLLIIMGLLTSFLKPVLYTNIVLKVKNSQTKVSSTQKKKSQKSLVLNSCLLCLCNFTCWFPTSILLTLFFFSQLNSRETPVAWSLITTLPINVSLKAPYFTPVSLFLLRSIFVAVTGISLGMSVRFWSVLENVPLPCIGTER